MQPLFVFMTWIQKVTALYERKAIFLFAVIFSGVCRKSTVVTIS